MATVSRLKPGQIVWDQRKVRDTVGIASLATWPVMIVAVNEDGSVVARWNHNPPKKYRAGSPDVKRWKVKRPERKTT